jgi:hypothetical protein
MMELPKGPYSVIYADPPWSYNDVLAHRPDLAVSEQYVVQPQQRIEELPIIGMAAPDCALFDEVTS